MQYYAVINGERTGPYTGEQFQQRVDAGEILPDTLVWRQGMTEWKPFARLNTTPDGAGTTGTCAECGGQFPDGDLMDYQGIRICAACKPLFLQRVREGADLPATYGAQYALRYAGFWIRVVAYLLDTLILYVTSVLIMFLPFMEGMSQTDPSGMSGWTILLSVLLNSSIAIAYFTGFTGRFAATPGKMALGLRVVRPDGGRVTYLRALGRYFGLLLSSVILYAGFIMAAFDDEKRTLHDRICDTRVVRK